jgi:hypothetical protein
MSGYLAAVRAWWATRPLSPVPFLLRRQRLLLAILAVRVIKASPCAAGWEHGGAEFGECPACDQARADIAVISHLAHRGDW